MYAAIVCLEPFRVNTHIITKGECILLQESSNGVISRPGSMPHLYAIVLRGNSQIPFQVHGILDEAVYPLVESLWTLDLQSQQHHTIKPDINTGSHILQ